MPEDRDLKSSVDYSEGQKQAAYSVLGEVVNILSPFAEDMRIVGGWVPSLLYQDKDHIGSIDVDVLLNQLNIEKKDGYATILELLRNNGYVRHPNPKKYFTYVKQVKIEGVVYTVDVDLLVMKAAAMGRGKPKDSYDIYFCLTNYSGGVRALAEAFAPYRDAGLVKGMRNKLAEKFASPNHAGPTDVVTFLGIQDEEEADRIRQDAYQRMKYLLDRL